MSGRSGGAHLVSRKDDAGSSGSTKRRRVERGVNQYESFGEYMAVKTRKLGEQLGDGGAGVDNLDRIFEGVSIHVNGYTCPSNLELRDLVVARGGDYQYYLTGKVTHVIATHLPDAKIKDVLASSRERIVHPDWIVQSCRTNKLLPCTDFLLYQRSSDQPTLHESLGPARVDDADDEEDENDADDPKSLGAHVLANEDDEWRRRNICTSPGFIERYFQTSRLHHLSSWRNELVRFVRNLPRPPRPQNATRPHAKAHQRTIMHIDMDSFFVSVGLRDRPHLRDKPVGVCHSSSASDMASAEVASCNYIARSFGVRNGSWLAEARKLCPDLVILPYEFDKYRAVTETLYRIFVSYADHIQAVSCDEALLDVSSRLPPPPLPASAAEDDATKRVFVEAVQALMSEIRTRIFNATGCTASIGASQNILLSRLSTRKAKPAGQFYLAADEVSTFINQTLVNDLPSVGHSVGARLEQLQIETCAQLQAWPLTQLQRELGNKVGSTLFNYCRGIDPRDLVEDQQRKTVGAEVNWGIRFDSQDQVQRFLYDLSCEVSRRMKDIHVHGRLITLKIMETKPDVHTTRKFLGHGPCTNISRSSTLRNMTDEPEVISQEAWSLYQSLNVSATNLRGVGTHLSRLEETSNCTTPNAPGGQPTISFANSRPALPRPAPPIDINMFRALPLEIQHEIARDLGTSVDELARQHQTSAPVTEFALSQPGDLNTTIMAGGSSAPPTLAAPTMMPNSDNIQKLALPSPSQVDRAVWENLPHDVRAELEAAYQHRNKELPRIQGKGKAKAMASDEDVRDLDKSFLAALPDDIRRELELDHQRQVRRRQQAPPPSIHLRGSPLPTLDGETTIAGVRSKLDAWVKSSDDHPLSASDREYVESFFVNHIRLRNVELPFHALRHLLRLTINRDAWREPMRLIVRNVQRTMQEEYGSPMAL